MELPRPVARLALLLLSLSLTGSSQAQTPVPGDPLKGSGHVSRTLLTRQELQSGKSTAPVEDATFALPDGAAMPRRKQTFQGRLRLLSPDQTGGFRAVTDPYNLGRIELLKHLPEFDFEFVQNGSHLIPVQQGLQYGTNPYYNYLIGPGRIWSESGDRGWSRASVPFALIERNQNGIHNGVLCFLFNGRSVSNVRYQITQETCTWFKFDLWGQVEGQYIPETIPGTKGLQNAHADEVANRLPTKPLSALTTDFPSAHVDLSAFGKGVTPEHRTVFGLFLNGTNYVGECKTRYGQYSFPEAMRFPSFSTAKSAFAGMALMRLVKKYGDGVRNLRIKDYLPECASSMGDWSAVTFQHALNMATGNYSQPGFMEDENGLPMTLSFLGQEKYADRIRGALSYGHKSPPGTFWVYRTADTFILTTAMRNYLRTKAGPSADLFTMLRDEVYIPSHLSAGALVMLRTDNSATGVPVGGYGLFLTMDDTAKLARLLNNDAGAIGGTQLLDPGMVAAGFQRDPAHRGLTTTGSYPYNYSNGFWSLQMTPSQYSVLKRPIWPVWMSGYGGIIILMMPNGSTYYHFSDNNEFPPIAPVVLESNKLSPQTP